MPPTPHISPHTHTQHQTYFDAADFPRNMPRIWDALFGFLEGATGRAVVMGEWGGFYLDGTPNKVFVDAFAGYLLNRCLSDNIYWVMNPNVRICVHAMGRRPVGANACRQRRGWMHKRF